MDILDKLKEKIGNTSLVEITSRNIPNGNRIFAKLEYENPTESHYDRIYWELFKHLESKGEINRGLTKLIEVSSGTAAISFSWFCKQLGYESKVILPNRMIKKIFEEFIDSSTEIIISNKNQYVAGAVSSLKEFMMANKNFYCMNHSRSEVSLIGTEKIGSEISDYFESIGIIPNIFIAACGNGLSIIGPGRVLKEKFPQLKIITFEDKNAPVGYKVKYPITFNQKYGNNFKFSTHHLYGTSAWGVYFPFIMDEKYKFTELVYDIILLKDLEWFSVDEELKKMNYDVGSTSLAAYFLAKDLSDSLFNQNIVILFYDKRSKYF